MINDVSFFDPKMDLGNIRTSSNRKEDADSSYDSILKSKLDNKPSSQMPTRHDDTEVANRDEPVNTKADKPLKGEKIQKADKPKVGNREPFFPAQPVPFHPELSDDDVQPEETEAPSNNFFDVRHLTGTPEDSGGVMRKAFDKSVVTYPVKQVASESIDDKVKQSLMAQGLWDMQGMYTAKPSKEFSNMLEMNQKQVVAVPKPVAQFMASMENELGVSPDRLVQAYSELPQGQLQKSPVETMAEVIKNLDLPPADEKKATQLYAKMLTELQKADQKPVLNADQEAKILLASALAEKKQAQVPASSFEVSSEAPKMKTMESGQQLMQQTAVVHSTERTPVLAHQLSKEHGLNDGRMGGQSFDGFSKEFKQENHNKAAAEAKAATHSTELSAGNHQQVSHNVFDSQLQDASGLTASDAVLMNNNTTDAKIMRQETIQGIINNAHALSQKGGGEMRMTLKPEHLGEIELKVSVAAAGDGNQVSVQMIAEKAEAKKLLEQNVQELRHGLASHNLSMGKLDVSLSDKNSTFQQQHGGRNEFERQSREFAQHFNGRQESAERELRDLRSGRATTKSMLVSRAQNPAMKIPDRRGAGRLNVVA